MKSVKLSLPAPVLTSLWPLLLGALLFVWPVVAGIPQTSARILWIALTFGLICLSTWQLARSFNSKDTVSFEISYHALGILVLLAAAIAAYGTHIPPLAFSDELTIAIPGRTAIFRLATLIGWPFIILGSAFGVVIAVLIARHVRWKTALLLLLVLASIAVFTALNSPTSGIAVRYPPVVHLMQVISTIFTGDLMQLFRFPNALWTLLLGLAVWNMLPEWKMPAKLATLAGIILGPLGWTYRTALFQACGELTLGFIAAVLLSRALAQKSSQRDTALLAITFALWFLYRPTAIAAIAAVTGVLLLLRQWKDVKVLAGITFPIVAAWLILSPLYTAQYGFFPADAAEPSALPPSFWFPITQAILALPHNFHPVGLAVLIGSSIAVCVFGKKKHMLLLGCAWLIALSTAAMQHLLAGPVFYGVARYNILMLVPQGIAIGALITSTRVAKVIGCACIVCLAVITPWKFISYTQELRTSAEDIYRMPTEGYLAFGLQQAVSSLLPASKDSIVIIAPHYTFLEAFVADGIISLADRDAIIERSKTWTSSSTLRPVVVQAPVVTRYSPNLLPDEIQRVADARTWALTLAHETISLGREETLIVH